VNAARKATACVNSIATSRGNVMAVCKYCGATSRPHKPDKDGEPDMWRMGLGWSCAPYPHDCRHDDGSVGSEFTCPTCNGKLHAGQTLRLRSYLPPRPVPLCRYEVLKAGQVVARVADEDAVYAAIRLLRVTGQRLSELRYRTVGGHVLIIPAMQP
jgi:hypothetical protein